MLKQEIFIERPPYRANCDLGKCSNKAPNMIRARGTNAAQRLFLCDDCYAELIRLAPPSVQQIVGVDMPEEILRLQVKELTEKLEAMEKQIEGLKGMESPSADMMPRHNFGLPPDDPGQPGTPGPAGEPEQPIIEAAPTKVETPAQTPAKPKAAPRKPASRSKKRTPAKKPPAKK